MPMLKLIRNSLSRNLVSRYHAVLPSCYPHCLHNDYQGSQTNGEENEDEVVDGGGTELPP